jgi:two-component system, NtrC family, sensor kinase
MALGVRAKLVLLSLAIVMAVSLGFTILHTRLAQGWVEDDLRDRAVAFAREIAATIGDRREFENIASLQSQIRQILAVRPSVLQLDILAFRPDTTTVVATSQPASRLPFHRQDADEVGRGRTLSRLIRRSGERAWEVMTPIVLDGDTVGAVAVLFSFRRADALAFRSDMWALGLTAGSALLVVLLMSGAVLLVVERPLHGLMGAIRAVRAGTSAAAAPVTSRDELGQLAEHFNEMMARINRFSGELQTRVDEATAELAQRYAELERLNVQLFHAQRSRSHAERLAVSGRLLAEVAHEIGTPLHSVAGHLEVLRQDLGEGQLDPRVVRRLTIIESEVTRLTQIIAQLLDLAHRPGGLPATLELNRLVGDTMDLVRPGVTGAGIHLVLDLEQASTSMRGHAGQLQQVVLNLLTNALDATPAGGRVSVRTRATRERLTLEVSDTGHGIPAAHRKHIFEPFFSTKEPGHGTGLGLLIASQIVREHGGDIGLESEEGLGTTLRVTLPREGAP